jgi:hypothetical protein
MATGEQGHAEARERLVLAEDYLAELRVECFELFPVVIHP